MQNQHASGSPIQLEDLLQVPLQVVRLEDLLREKSSSVSPPQSRNPDTQADGRLCRSADSLVPKPLNSPSINDINSKSSSSAPCLFDCCLKSTSGSYGGEKFARDVKFKTAALSLPDGSSVVVPIVDFNNALKQKTNVKIPTTINHNAMDNGNDSDRTTSASPPPIDSVTPPLSPPQPMVSSVVLGTVTEEPTRFEDFLLAQGCKIRNNSIIGDNRIQQTNGDGRSGVIGPIPQKPAGANTLELTLYNNGRKESEKEFRPHMKDQDVRYFENQQLQLSRVIREPGHVHPQIVGNRSQITNQNNTHHFPRHKQHGNNNNITNTNNTSSQIFAQPHLKLTNLIIKNLNTNVNSNRTSVSNNSCNDNNGKTWEQIGLKISRCQRDERRVITVENDISGERAPEKTLALDGEPIRDKGEDEILIERHLQAYLTSLKYVKPGAAEHNNKVEAVPEFRGRSITHGLSGIAPQAIRVASPCEPAQITRIPNVRPPTSSPASAQQQHHHSEAWPERTIARIPAKPYLGRDIPRELPQQQIYPPAKRFRANGNMPQTNRQIMPRQQVNNQQQITTTTTPHQQQQYISAHNTNAIPNGDVDKNPALRNQLVHCASLRQQLQQHPISYHASSTVPAPQHSPSIAQAHAQQQYHHHQLQQQQKYPNNAAQQQQLEESRIFLAALAAGGEGLDSAYCERLRRYWEYYQTREVDWAKLSEYYQKYNFYPWDILSARDESIRQWRQQQQQQQSVVTHPQLQVQLTPQIDGRPIELENLTQQQQHQLALRAMNLAAVNYANSRSHHSEASAASSPASISMHNRIAGMDVSPPSTSPLPAQVQNKYNHNSQQLQQLQQLHHQKHLSLQQQQQVQQQQQHNQRLRYTQEQHHQQQLQQQKAQQVVLMANQKLQHSANYYSAYNQLAAAAAAISSSYSNSQNQPRLSPHQQQPRENNIPPIVLLDEEKDNEAEDIPVPVNIHRQTLELAMKNNFKNRSNNNSQQSISASNIINAALASQQYPNRNNNNVVRVRKDIVVAPSQTQPQQITATIPPHHHHPHPHHQQQQHQQRTLPKNGNGSNNICSVNGAINMTKESLRTTSSSPNSSSQSTVIRRLRILQPKMPASYASPSATVQQTTSTNETVRASVQNSLDNSDAMQPIPLVLHKNNQYGRSNEYATSHGDNRNVDGKRNGGNQQHSPLPMVAGEEEVIANVSPSAILSNYDDMPGENDNNSDEKDPYNNSSDTPEPGDGGGSWQYDHVVLLDKRIKTYMCKRCFETLKTEQEIRNHLFCKMLANHVQCHVCLQLFTSDAYPAHLQIHGVRPLEDAQSDD